MPASSLDLFLDLVAPIEALGLRYVVTGSVASIVYGEPRLTHDIDIVLELGVRDAERFVGAFPESDFYCPPDEIVRVEARRASRGHFNVIHHQTGFKADVYLMGRDPLHAWALDRRRRIPVGERGLWLAPPEYVILRKLEYFIEGGSEKHIRDIEAMVEGLGEGLDRQGLLELVAQGSPAVRRLLDEVLARVSDS